MFGTLIEALKSVIDLRAKAREDKKVGLEIRKLEEERQDRDRLIERATREDVKKYDTKFKRLKERMDEHRVTKQRRRAAPPVPPSHMHLEIFTPAAGTQPAG